jgi:hypothetical protein
VLRRALLVAAVSVIAAAAVAQLRAHEAARPVAVIGRAEASTTTVAAPATTAPIPTTTTTVGQVVVANRSTTVVQAGGGRVSVTNEGSATASTGGNVAIGPESATVVNGPVTAVGNSADVRVSRP